MVERYLDSPRYGENQARYWLDAVRYGDTHGLHLDNYREVYPYRDWVVRSFNDDLPYDKFVTWQLAGDLLPDPTIDQLIATGFVRMNPTSAEGGAIEKEFKVKNTGDRVDTTSTVLLGMTMACARCHDHKYDPLTHENYYQFYAYFNSTADPILDGNSAVHPPVIKAPSPEQRQEDLNFQKKLATIESTVDEKVAMDWMQDIATRIPSIGAWEKATPIYTAADFVTVTKTAYDPELPEKAKSVEWKQFDLAQGKTYVVVGKENAAAYLRTTIVARKDTEYTLQMGADDALQVWLNGQPAYTRDALGALVVNGDQVKLNLKTGKNELLVKVMNGPAGDGFHINYGDEVSRLVQSSLDPQGKVKVDETGLKTARGLYLRVGPTNSNAEEYRRIFGQYQTFLASIPTTLVAQELPKPEPSFVLRRGEYDKPEQEVTRGIPEVLNPLPKGAPNNRLGLANWMTDPANPLVARVYVNRVWQQHFGIGIVETSEDFGSQGSWPSHPDLLDWLSV